MKVYGRRKPNYNKPAFLKIHSELIETGIFKDINTPPRDLYTSEKYRSYKLIGTPFKCTIKETSTLLKDLAWQIDMEHPDSKDLVKKSDLDDPVSNTNRRSKLLGKGTKVRRSRPGSLNKVSYRKYKNISQKEMLKLLLSYLPKCSDEIQQGVILYIHIFNPVSEKEEK